MKLPTCSLLLLTLFVSSLNAQESKTLMLKDGVPLQLWDGHAPGSGDVQIVKEVEERPVSGYCTRDRKMTHVKTPLLTPYLPADPNGTAVIICPGGAYEHLSRDIEGTDIAKWLNEAGITAFVLTYRLPADRHDSTSWVALQDLQRAMRLIRRNCEDWGLNPSKIGVIGFSAGGHNAAMLAAHHDLGIYEPDSTDYGISARPDFVMLLYSVISMTDPLAHTASRRNLLGEGASEEFQKLFSPQLHVTSDFPPVFIAATEDDTSVDPANSRVLARSLKKNRVPHSLNIYETGGHGTGICKAFGTEFVRWPADCTLWMWDQGFIKDPFNK